MINEGLLKKIDVFLRSRPLWINSSEVVDGEIVLIEFFIKKLNGRFFVGFDRYNEKYEDATDLYEKYIRSDFPDLTSSLNFINEKLPVKLEDLDRVISN